MGGFCRLTSPCFAFYVILFFFKLRQWPRIPPTLSQLFVPELAAETQNPALQDTLQAVMKREVSVHDAGLEKVVKETLQSYIYCKQVFV